MTDTPVKYTFRFSPRQVEVVYLIARGLTMAEIADQLGLKTRTVKSFCDTLRWKLGVQSQREIPLAYFERTGDSPYPTAPVKGSPE